jgi:16S rRNA (guanine1207-N2)-methyltransferase
VEGASGGQYFEARPEVASQPGRVRLDLPDGSVELETDRGVFAHTAVDPGTRYLLRAAPDPPASAHQLLDLGCGYGPIAITLARRHPDATVWAVDVNERAVSLTRRNAAALGLTNVRALVADDVATALASDLVGDVRFDAIWSNPPIRIGKAALHEMLASWLGRMASDGRATLVVQKHLGSDSLARWLAEQGWDVRRLGSRAGYRLLDVTASRDDPA